ncbi:hypothetical protein [Arthrobacter sp. TMN-50]
MSEASKPTNRTVHATGPDGTIRDWLVSPAWAAPCGDLENFLSPDGNPWGEGRWVLTNGPDVGDLKERLYQAHPITTQALPEPQEGGDIQWSADGTVFQANWRRTRTGKDGLLDWSAFCFTPEYRYSLASTVLEVDQSDWRTIELHTTGPFVLWLDGEVVLQSGKVSYMEPEVHSVRVRLHSRTTTVHLAMWQVAFRECRQIARLRVVGLPVRVVIPSPGADESAARLAETILAQVASRSWAQEGREGTLRAPAGTALRLRVGEHAAWQHLRADENGTVTYLLEDAPEEEDEGADVARTAGASMLSSGESIVEVGLDDARCPQTLRMRVAVLPPLSTNEPSGDPESWRHEVLEHITGRGEAPPRETGVAGLLGRYALDDTTTVGAEDLESALHRVLTRGDCADFEVVSLLLAWHWIPEQQWDAAVRTEVAAAITGMKYWITQPGLDAMCYFTENHQFVWHVAELLAGETFPDAVFDVDCRSGSEHAAEASARAAGWLTRKLRGGFSEFDSNAYLAIDSYALCALIELSQEESLVNASRTLLDKVLVTLATNSWRGTHGAAHGRSYVHTLRSSRFEETSPILRLIAGVGTLNDAVLPVTALTLARKYSIPDVVRELAGNQPDEWWGRQVYRGELAYDRDLLERPYRSDLRIYKTPDVMLSSVQDYRAGLPGLQEHVWGATLGRELQVFVTHPANSDTGSSARPNAWAGHRILPRVHQHRESLVHLQRFTTTDPERTTHLWLPITQTDEHVVIGDWILARRGNGYVAVATPGGVREMFDGETAGQEWLPARGGSVWVGVVGRATVDGDFAQWVERLTANPIDWHPRGEQDPGVRFQRHGKPTLEVSFDTAFLVDGVPAGLVDGVPERDPHLENPAVCAEFGDPVTDVNWNGKSLRLEVAEALSGMANRYPLDAASIPKEHAGRVFHGG